MPNPIVSCLNLNSFNINNTLIQLPIISTVQQLDIYILNNTIFDVYEWISTTYYVILLQLLKMRKLNKICLRQYVQYVIKILDYLVKNMYDTFVSYNNSFWVRLGFSCEFSIWLASCCSLVIGLAVYNFLYQCYRVFQPIRGSQLMNYR